MQEGMEEVGEKRGREGKWGWGGGAGREEGRGRGVREEGAGREGRGDERVGKRRGGWPHHSARFFK